MGNEQEKQSTLIPPKILAQLIAGDKIRVWGKHSRKVRGIVYWDGFKMIYSSKADLS